VVALPDEPGNAAGRLRQGGVEVVTLPLSRLRATPNPATQLSFGRGFRPQVKRLQRLIEEQRVDLVVIGGLANPHAGFAARRAKVPVVWQFVDSRLPGALRRPLSRLVLKLANAMMFDGASLIPLHFGRRALRRPVFVYFPPVVTERFIPSAERRARARNVLKIPSEAPVVGTVANINPQKGIEYFVRSAGLIYRQRPDCYFVVVGAEYESHRAYSSAVRNEVATAGIPAERFVFAGDQPDVEAWYPAMDVKLITSVPRSEGTTTTAMEAMACGVPVVAADVGAVREVVADGQTGFVVPPIDPGAMAAATLRLLDDPSLLRMMGNEARTRAVTLYDVEICADVHQRAFAAAMEQPMGLGRA